ncbi:MAG: TetR/AcrR family transcriptional regulator [Oscillospiraceae bacterium]|nr:TetR/AcrR family transcriptional regulator [Oscillospiraceae bacterium]
MTEFGDHGYEKASTNRIVQTAGIGKGMLFYYFGSKLELYHALIDQCREQLETHMKILQARPDQLGIIETFQYATRLKMELQLENPALFHFITRLYLNPEEVTVSEATSQNFHQLTALRERVMGELFIAADTSRLRPDIPQERLIRYLSWAMEGYTQHIINVVRTAPPEKMADLDMTRYWEEYDTYTEDLKTLFYCD